MNRYRMDTMISLIHNRLGGEKSAEFKNLVESFEQDAAASMLLELAAEMGVELT